MRAPSFGYVQARLQAHHGLLLGEADWRRLESNAQLGGYLHGLRRTHMEPWVRRLSEASSPHDIEQSLRADWRRHVAEVAHWQPGPWRRAVTWVGVLTDLPVAIHLLRGRGPQRWMLDDPVYADWVKVEQRGLADAVAVHLGPELAAACATGHRATAVWLKEWRTRWPDEDSATRDALSGLATRLLTHGVQMATREDPMAGPQLRSELRHRLLRIFRQAARSPPAVFAHLGIIALELERLRGSLLDRCLFRAEGVAP
jgi:hypothetical protein